MSETTGIHHRCRCLGRDFTFNEWGTYLKENPSGGAVLAVGTFQFNIFDVCLNPNRPVRLANNFCNLEVRTARSPNGRWDCGYSINLHTEGCGHGAAFVDDGTQGFPTEKEAVYAALAYAEERTARKIKELEKAGDMPSGDCDEESERQPKASAVISSMRAFLKDIQSRRDWYDPRQLSLFG